MSEVLKQLLEKLERAKFSGRLTLTFESGQISGAELRHLLPFAELQRELPALEEEGEFQLKP